MKKKILGIIFLTIIIIEMLCNVCYADVITPAKEVKMISSLFVTFIAVGIFVIATIVVAVILLKEKKRKDKEGNNEK